MIGFCLFVELLHELFVIWQIALGTDDNMPGARLLPNTAKGVPSPLLLHVPALHAEHRVLGPARQVLLQMRCTLTDLLVG